MLPSIACIIDEPDGQAMLSLDECSSATIFTSSGFQHQPHPHKDQKHSPQGPTQNNLEIPMIATVDIKLTICRVNRHPTYCGIRGSTESSVRFDIFLERCYYFTTIASKSWRKNNIPRRLLLISGSELSIPTEWNDVN